MVAWACTVWTGSVCTVTGVGTAGRLETLVVDPLLGKICLDKGDLP